MFRPVQSAVSLEARTYVTCDLLHHERLQPRYNLTFAGLVLLLVPWHCSFFLLLDC